MSIIMFLPEEALKNNTQLHGYINEPVPDCDARQMVAAYYQRSGSLERHATNPVNPMPRIYFETEKIAYQVPKDFLAPFFNGTIPGCEGVTALNCIDLDRVGKQYTSIILFGVDANGNPLPFTNGYRFHEKWPGRLLSETPVLLTRYFPGCKEAIDVDSSLVFKFNSLADPVTPLNFPEAKALLNDIFIPEFTKVVLHLTAPGGIANRPVLPRTHQNIAFAIDIDELEKRVLQYNPVNVACILCINDNFSSVNPNDDSLSVMFVGLNSQNRPVGDAAIEKWPGIYLNSQAADVKNKILNPDPTLSITPEQRAEFSNAHALVDDFTGIWAALLRDAATTPVPVPRPRIRLNNHPFVFFVQAQEFQDMLNLGPAAIAGVFIFDNRAGYDFIAPLFVPIDGSERPLGKIVDTRERSGLTFSQKIAVINSILTP